MDRYILRAGGSMVLVVYSTLSALFIIVLLGNLSDWYTTGQFNIPMFSLIMGMFACLLVLFTWSFLKTKIEIRDNLFIGRTQLFVLKDVLSFRYFSTVSYPIHSKIGDFESVFIGELGRISDIAKDIDSPQVVSFFAYYRNTGMTLGVTSPFAQIPKWTVSKYMPIIFVRTKNLRDSFILIAKPFSRRGLRKLVSILKSKGVTVMTKSSWKLE